MTAAFRSHLTKIAALLLGVGLGFAGSRGEPPASEKDMDAAGPTVRGANSSPGVPTARAADHRHTGDRPSESTEAYAAAWNSLKEGRLSTMELRAIQAKLLEEWSLIDLEAALRAAFEEPSGTHVDEARTSRDCCLDGIRRQPNFAWELIASGSFGFQTKQLRDLWVKALMGENPMAGLDRYSEFPTRDLDIQRYEPKFSSPFGAEDGMDLETIFSAEVMPRRADESYTQRSQLIIWAIQTACSREIDPSSAGQIMGKVALLGKGDDGDFVIQVASNTLAQMSTTASLNNGYDSTRSSDLRDLYVAALVTKFSDVDDQRLASMTAELSPGLRTRVVAGLKARGR